MRILIIEDNAELAANIGDYLEAAGHAADFAAHGRHGLDLARAGEFDAIVLDLNLPGLDGVELCDALRRDGSDIPVLMLTARDTLPERLEGFGAGADDYLVKPFSLAELLARLTALARRASGGVGRRRLALADLEYDPETLRARRGGRELRLQPVQRRLLELLLRNSARVVRRSELERVVWGESPPQGDALRAHIHLLRNAVDRGHEVKLLHTVPGVGYRLARPHEL